MTKLPQLDTPEPPPPPPLTDGAPAMPPPIRAKPGKFRTYISIAVLIVIGAGVLWIVRNSADAGALAVGTCMDVPTEGDFSTVTKHDCNEAHDAEVVLVGELTGDTFPISLTLEGYITDNCVPAVEAYTGRAAATIDDLELGYFSPTSDAWKDGERTITCYLYDINSGKLTHSVKAGAAPAGT